MEGHSLISPEVLARYAADAAREVPGVTGLVEGALRHKGVRVDGGVVELHLAVGWGVSIPDVGATVQQRVVEYLGRMADVRPAAVNVVVDEIVG
jgi:uncharacterized alkaline shock family protein YloU